MSDNSNAPKRADATSSFREEAQRHEIWRAAQSEADLVRANLECIRFHCEAFDIPREVRACAALVGFEDIVRAAGRGVIESSVKVVNGVPHPARFNILCSPDDKLSFLHQMFTFVENVARTDSIRLDLRPVREMLVGADLSRVSQMVCGVDLRADKMDSRLKIWVFADHEPGNANDPIERALASGRVDPRFHSIHVHPALLLGYDLRFDGATALKMYPDVWEEELEVPAIRSRLSGVFSSAAMRVIREAYWTHFYLSSEEKQPALDLHLKNPDEFIARWLSNPIADRIHRAYSGCPMLDVVAAIPQSELESALIENFTLYYMPAGF
jgi:LynF/TruF/PatF family peptide O-prenyltransferase